MGYTRIECPYIPPVNVHDTVGRREVLTEGAGAFVFTFGVPTGTFQVLYAAVYKEDSWCGYKLISVALVPPEFLRSWAALKRYAITLSIAWNAVIGFILSAGKKTRLNRTSPGKMLFCPKR